MSGQPVAPTEMVHDLVENEIEKRATDFDLFALVDLLRFLGYQDEEIEFQSHDTLLHAGCVVDSVRFRRAPSRRTIVCLNLGWLSPQTPLPNYFRRILLLQKEESLSDFLGFFSHWLLKGTAAASFPERDQTISRNWLSVMARLFSLLGLRSTYTVHWVFSHVFPELEVAVGRSIVERKVRASFMILGEWIIGDGSVCGGFATILVSAVSITLYADHATCGCGRPWPIEAMRRLHDHVLPALDSRGLFLDVKLVLRDQSSFMMLAPNQFLGFEPLSGSSQTVTARTKSERTIVLLQGEATPHRDDTQAYQST